MDLQLKRSIFIFLNYYHNPGEYIAKKPFYWKLSKITRYLWVNLTFSDFTFDNGILKSVKFGDYASFCIYVNNIKVMDKTFNNFGSIICIPFETSVDIDRVAIIITPRAQTCYIVPSYQFSFFCTISSISFIIPSESNTLFTNLYYEFSSIKIGKETDPDVDFTKTYGGYYQKTNTCIQIPKYNNTDTDIRYGLAFTKNNTSIGCVTNASVSDDKYCWIEFTNNSTWPNDGQNNEINSWRWKNSLNGNDCFQLYGCRAKESGYHNKNYYYSTDCKFAVNFVFLYPDDNYNINDDSFSNLNLDNGNYYQS